MADFLNDYSGVAAAGEGFKSFADAFERAQDNKAKRQEMQARMQAEQSKNQRDADMAALAQRQAGVQKDPLTGQMVNAPMTPQRQIDEDLKGAGEGYNVKRDENGNYTGLEVNQNSPKMIQARNSGLRGQATMQNVGLREDKMSADAAGKIHNDKVIVPLRAQASNIDKGLDTLNGSATHKPSWLEVNEVAQDYANALSGAKGSSDFKLKQSEQESFDKYLGDLKGKIQSNPDQPADQAYVDFYKKFGDRLKQTYDHQLSGRADNLLKGAKGAYRHNPNAFQSMSDAASIYKSGKWRDADLSEYAPGQQSQDQPQGLVGGQGLVKPGLVGGGQQAAPAGTVQMKAPDGTIRAVPLNQVDAALANGGKRL